MPMLLSPAAGCRADAAAVAAAAGAAFSAIITRADSPPEATAASGRSGSAGPAANRNSTASNLIGRPAAVLLSEAAQGLLVIERFMDDKTTCLSSDSKAMKALQTVNTGSSARPESLIRNVVPPRSSAGAACSALMSSALLPCAKTAQV